MLTDLTQESLIVSKPLDQFVRAQADINAFLDAHLTPAGIFRFQQGDGTWIDNRSLTRRALIDLVIHGDFAHVSKAQGERVEQWKDKGVYEGLIDELCLALMNVIVKLRWICTHAIQPALVVCHG